jgi:co-chaperonin GroES (HSP10)
MMKENGPKPDSAAAARARASHALVEAAARGALRDMKPPPDLMTEGFPFTPAYWMIVVEPLQPREESDGGIAVVDLSQEAESYQMTVGRVLKVGPACMDGQTTGGVKLNNFTADIQKPEDLIGKYVVYQLHVGQEITLRKTGQVVKVMKVTELLGVTDEPYSWKFYI